LANYWVLLIYALTAGSIWTPCCRCSKLCPPWAPDPLPSCSSGWSRCCCYRRAAVPGYKVIEATLLTDLNIHI